MKEFPSLDAQAVFRFGFMLELGLVAVAALLGYALRGQPFPFEFRLEWTGLWQSLAASAPMVVLALLMVSKVTLRVPPLRRIYLAIRRILGRPLRDMDLQQIVLLSFAAGVGEEALFRGVLQESWGPVWTSVLFGALHAVTIAYFILAALISLYLGWLMEASGNLLVPVVAHAAYDTLALLLLRYRFRREDLSDLEGEGREEGEEATEEAPGSGGGIEGFGGGGGGGGAEGGEAPGGDPRGREAEGAQGAGLAGDDRLPGEGESGKQPGEGHGAGKLPAGGGGGDRAGGSSGS